MSNILLRNTINDEQLTNRIGQIDINLDQAVRQQVIHRFELQLNKQSLQMNSMKDNKPNHQRNITPNFLRFKRKSTSKNSKGEEEGTQTNYPTERSGSKASRSSFDVYQKRVLDLNKLKNTLTTKEKENSVEPSKKKRQGLEVTSRRNTSSKKEQEDANIKKSTNNNNSNKNLKLRLASSSRDKSQKGSSVPKRSEQSLEKEEQRAKLQNKELLTTLMQQQFAPNYMNKLKIKKMEQKEQKQQKQKIKIVRKKFMNVDFDIKGQQQLKYYQVYEQLGKGAYGVVKMGISKRTNQKVAIKIYEKKRLDQPNKLKNLQRQVNILSKLNHPVIAKLIDVIQSSTQIYLIQEYGGANSLYNYLLSKPQHRLPQSQAKQFFKTITETLAYLHQRNIVHRDIKAENILLNRNKQLKLIDFGFSLESIPPGTIDTFCGTPTYMAPEIVSKRDHIPIYTDLWSLGVFLFVILQGNYPFRAKNQNQLFQKIKKGQFEYIHKDISQKLKHVIERLIRVNPLQRMSTKQMKDPFWQWLMSEKPYCNETTTATNATLY